jgi:hypothetical protein
LEVLLFKFKVLFVSSTHIHRAKQLGCKFGSDNGLAQKENGTWIFGPCPAFDCVWQIIPQVTLHGMDEGLTAKLAKGILLMAIIIAERSGGNATQVQNWRLMYCTCSTFAFRIKNNAISKSTFSQNKKIK